MSRKYIGDTIDIHAGGEDLIFPHHENEIAQSEACNGEKFANYWMHNGFLNIDNKKMSKSAGNFFTVREIGEKYPLQVIRFFMLSAHYRSPLNFSDTLVESAKHGLERILTAVDHLRDVLAEKQAAGAESGAAPDAMTPEDQKNVEEAKALVAKFEASMEDDFNTADAIAAIFELVKLSNVTADHGSAVYVEYLLETITKLCDILGIITEKKEEMLGCGYRGADRGASGSEKGEELRESGRDPRYAGGKRHHSGRYKGRCKMEESLKVILDSFPLDAQKVKTYSALSFAYIGDSVYDLIIRTMITVRGNTKPNKYHRQAIEYVNAGAQTRMMEQIRPFLNEEEKVIFRRGKNAKPASHAKNQSPHDYRIATGFETLIGYLYLTGQVNRIMELITIGLEKEEESCHTKKNTVIGRNAVLEAFRAGKTVDKYLCWTAVRDGPVRSILRESRKQSTLVKYVSKEKLDSLSNHEKHQGVVAITAACDYAEMDDLFAAAQAKGEDPFFILCDEIEDPHNLGAIIRTANLAGAHGVISRKDGRWG